MKKTEGGVRRRKTEEEGDEGRERKRKRKKEEEKGRGRKRKEENTRDIRVHESKAVTHIIRRILTITASLSHSPTHLCIQCSITIESVGPQYHGTTVPQYPSIHNIVPWKRGRIFEGSI